MALQPCRECGREVSTEAQTCPHCGVGRPTEAVSTADPGAPQPSPATAQPRRLWPTIGCLGLLLLFLWAVGQGSHDHPAPLSLGQVYRVKRSLPACPSSEDLSQVTRLLMAKDYQAASAFMLRQSCLLLQEGWDVAYDGHGGLGVVKVRRPGDPDDLFTDEESIR
jgi:hypothetical protein